MRNPLLPLLLLITSASAGIHLLGFDAGTNFAIYAPMLPESAYNQTITVNPTPSTAFRYRYEVTPWFHLQSALRFDYLYFYAKSERVSSNWNGDLNVVNLTGNSYYELKSFTVSPELSLRFNRNFSRTALYCGGGVSLPFPLSFKETTLFGIWNNENKEGTTPNISPHVSGGITFRSQQKLQFSFETRYRIWTRSLGKGMYKDNDERAKGITLLISVMWKVEKGI